MPTELIAERRGTALVLTLTDPPSRNSLSPEACRAGIDATLGAAGDDGVRSLIVRGEGAHFCSGGNLQRLLGVRELTPQHQADAMSNFHGWIAALRNCPKPVIAAVEGFAAGGGFALALACDLIVAADDARFVLSYSKIGLSPDGGSSWHLARLLPRALALQMLLMPEPVSARELHTRGLVNAITLPGGAFDEALAYSERLGVGAPNAYASAKRLVNEAPSRSLEAHLDEEREHLVRNLFAPNGGEGLSAFIERRPPRFT